MPDDRDDRWREFAEASDGSAEGEKAPAKLRSRIFSRMNLEQAKDGPLASVTESKAEGRELCVFEEMMRVAPVGEAVRELNYCRVCHARVLGERMDDAPIWWAGCPYAEFHKKAGQEG
ncbi:MAG: hypothetical protein U0Q16_08230 [Bryobacteraceae bacterium]